MRTLRDQDGGWGCTDCPGRGGEYPEQESMLAEKRPVTLLANPVEEGSETGNKWLNGDAS